MHGLSRCSTRRFLRATSTHRFRFSSFSSEELPSSSQNQKNDRTKNEAMDSKMLRTTRNLLKQHIDQHSTPTVRGIFEYWIDNAQVPDSVMELLAMHGASSEYVVPLLTKWLRQGNSDKDRKLGSQMAKAFQHRGDSARLVLELKLLHTETEPTIQNLLETFRSFTAVSPTAADYALLLTALVRRCPPRLNDAVDEEIKRTFIKMKSLGVRPDAACYAAGLQFYSGVVKSQKTVEFDELWKDMEANQIVPNVQCYHAALVAALNAGKIRVAVEALKPIVEKEREDEESKYHVTGEAAHRLLKHFRVLIRERNEQGSLVSAAENVANTVSKLVAPHWQVHIRGTLMDIYSLTKQYGKVEAMIKDGDAPADILQQSMLIKSWIAAGKHEKAIDYIRKYPRSSSIRTAFAGWAIQGESGWQRIQRLIEVLGTNTWLDNIKTYNTLLTAATNAEPRLALERCNSIWKRLSADSKHEPDIVTYNLMLAAALRSGRRDVAQATLRHFTPDIRTYSLLLKDTVENEDTEKAEQMLLEKMPRSGVQPNVHSYMTVLHGWRRAKQPDRLVRLHEEMIRQSIEPTRETYKALVSGLAEHRSHVAQADAILQEIETRELQPDRFLYIAVFKGYISSRNPDAATRLLIRQIKVAKRDKTLLPPPSAMHALVNAWIKGGNFASATDILCRLQQLKDTGLLVEGPDIGTGTALWNNLRRSTAMSPEEKAPYLESLNEVIKRMQLVAHLSRASNTSLQK